MSDQADLSALSLEGVERQPLRAFSEQAYLNYSMYVIMDRALPHVGDGLKPVQRRIIYAMSELGLSAAAKYKKSARTVGDVLGKYHPHGDSACYEAMVLMAQPFSYRYPLIDGQGNWGAQDDPKSFAAMRYTEARLAKFSEVLLSELGQGTVEWGPNFDGTLKEPLQLPARLPHILLNGVTGIAVGMATDIPPHNAREVTAACVHLLKNPKADVPELMQFVQGPDFPTDAEIITPRADLEKIYNTGRGSVKMRATWVKEDGEIVITALPHQVSGGKILEQIAAQMNAKKLPMISDLRDESDHENPTRIVLVPRSNRVDLAPVMDHLFATTDLERSYRVNINVLGLDGRPQVKPLNVLLGEWLEFRSNTVRRRLQHRLEKVLARLHILDGMLIAFLNIDEVIDIIRTSDEPKAELIKRFGLSEKQAEAVLELKLRQLAKLEEIKIRGEQAELSKERDHLQGVLGSERKLKNLVARELQADAEKYGDERRSPIVERSEAHALSEKDLVPAEPVTVVVSDKGWVRCAKGHEVDPTGMTYKAGDSYLASARGRSNQPVVFLDSGGRAYATDTHTLPGARGQGEPLSGRFNLSAGERVEHVLIGQDDTRFLLASDAGYGFIGKYADMVGRNKAGKAYLTVPTGANVLPPLEIPAAETGDETGGEQAELLCAAVSNEGRLLLFPLDQLPQLAKGKGNRLINISASKVASREEYVKAMAVLPADRELVIHAGKRHMSLKLAELEHYLGDRGRRGHKLPRGFQRVDALTVN